MDHKSSAGIRIAAYSIDLIIHLLLLTPLWIWFFRGLFSDQSGTYLLGYSLLIPFAWGASRFLYYLIFLYFINATPAMMLLGLRLASSKNEGISILQIILRCIGTAVSTLTIGTGFLSIWVSRKKLALQDILSSTIVVRNITPCTNNAPYDRVK